MTLSKMQRAPQSDPGATDSSAGRGQADFKLLRFFTTASLVAFVVVAVLLGYIFRTLSIDGLLKGYESEHVNHAQFIANEMWDSEFGPLVLAMAGKSAAELQRAPQLPALHQKVLKLLRGGKIFKIKVYDLKGMTIYSTELTQIGEDKSNNRGVIGGLQGMSSSELVHRDQFNAFEGEVQNRDVVETYVPRYDPDSGKIGGVFEIADGFVELVLLPQVQGRIKPSRRIVRIEPLGQIEFLLRRLRVTEFAGGFTEIAAEQTPLRFESSGGLKRRPGFGKMASAQEAKPASKPRRAECRVQLTRVVEGALRRMAIALVEQNETTQRMSGSQLR